MEMIRSRMFPGVSLSDGVVDYSERGLQVAVGAWQWQQGLERAQSHCATLFLGGKNDWRLPTVHEVGVFGSDDGRLKDSPDNYFFGDLSRSNAFVIWTDAPGSPGYQITWGLSQDHRGFGETPSQGWAIDVLCVRNN